MQTNKFQDRERIIDRVKKCLRLAKSNEPHEAAAALRQAQKLIAEHDLTEAEIAASEADTGTARAGRESRPNKWEVALANMIASTFGCEVIFATRWNMGFYGEYNFVGVAPNGSIAGYAFSVLKRQLVAARREYTRTTLKRCGPTSKTRRADGFCLGWVYSVERQAIALVCGERERQIVQAYVELNFGETTSVKPFSRGNGLSPRDRMNGWEEGEKARLHHGVGAQSGPALLR